MRCTKCGFDNNENAKFCGKCGAPLGAGERTAGPAPAEAAKKARRGGKWLYVALALCVALAAFLVSHLWNDTLGYKDEILLFQYSIPNALAYDEEFSDGNCKIYKNDKETLMVTINYVDEAENVEYVKENGLEIAQMIMRDRGKKIFRGLYHAFPRGYEDLSEVKKSGTVKGMYCFKGGGKCETEKSLSQYEVYFLYDENYRYVCTVWGVNTSLAGRVAKSFKYSRMGVKYLSEAAS